MKQKKFWYLIFCLEKSPPNCSEPTEPTFGKFGIQAVLMQTALNSKQVLLWGSLNPAWFPVKLKKNRLTWVVLVQSMFLICLLDDNITKIILITLKNISVCHLDLYDRFLLPSLSSESGLFAWVHVCSVVSEATALSFLEDRETTCKSSTRFRRGTKKCIRPRNEGWSLWSPISTRIWAQNAQIYTRKFPLNFYCFISLNFPEANDNQ